MWILVENGNLTQDDGEVLAFHPEWIDEDFNPKGTRVGFVNGDGNFYSAKWIYYTDCYVNSEEQFPTHFQHIEETFNLKK